MNHVIGGKMITALWKKYEIAIEAETDDDAVDFYRKRGFSVTATQKYGVRRWTCVRSALEAAVTRRKSMMWSIKNAMNTLLS